MPARAQLRCPRCGTPVEPSQTSCLHCGAPLPRARVTPLLAAAWKRALPWYPGDWIWPVLALAVLTAASTAAALGARDARRDSAPTLVETGSHVTVSIGSVTTPTQPQPTISTGTLPVAPGAPSTSVPTTPPPTTVQPPITASAIRSWPSGTSGWTDVLESLSQSSGRATAVARARDAYRAGITDVGALLSSQYGTLRAGYWVVFSGVYETSAQAQAGLAAVRARGFAGAYPAQVVPGKG